MLLSCAGLKDPGEENIENGEGWQESFTSQPISLQM